MIKRIQIYVLLAIIIGCVVWRHRPKEGQLEPHARIVSYGNGDHGDVTFTNPTIVLLSGQYVRFGNLTFANQSNCCWQGSVIITEIITNLTCKTITVTNCGGPAVSMLGHRHHKIWLCADKLSMF